MSGTITLRTWTSNAMAELISGQAHRVHAGDVTQPLGARLQGEPLLLVMVAREKAATVRVTMSQNGIAQIGATRQVPNRGQGELARVLQAEARATGARWGLVVLALGWQAILGTRAARPGAEVRAFERFRLPLEQPDLFCAQPQAESLYTCVDHPTLDRSVVFSVRRREVEEVLQDLRMAGLQTAAVRVGVAAQLEAWLAARGEEGLAADILVSDSLGGLLLQVEQRDFRAPAAGTGNVGGTGTASMDARPRQVTSRPNDIIPDLARFLRDRGAGGVCFLGASELAAPVLQALNDERTTLVRAPEGPWHDAVSAALAAGVIHDLNPDLREERAPLAQAWRKYVLAALALSAGLTVMLALNLWQVAAAEWNRQTAAERAAHHQTRRERAEGTLAGFRREHEAAHQLGLWLAHNYHAQPFAHDLLRAVPPDVVLERIAAHLEESGAQMTLEFTLLGDDNAQAGATRAMERAVLGRGWQIGERHPATSQPRGAVHRWRLLQPSAGGGENEQGGGRARIGREWLWARDGSRKGESIAAGSPGADRTIEWVTKEKLRR